MSPVEHTSTSSAVAAELGGDERRTCARRRRGPASPVAALALPLLRMTAAARPPVACEVVPR